ncbi:MAG: CidA/LrgA family protein [Oscillospiraceae bacterium]|nr:CidA/LrgA family protein [Oscillospiraceae bacterium]
MKYISQICIIFGFTLLGEGLQRLVPVSIPASVYGLVLLFLALMTGVVKLEQVKEAGDFLRSLLPLLFVGPTVGILEHWELIRGELFPILLIVVSTTAVTFGISGVVTQRINEKGGKTE